MSKRNIAKKFVAYSMAFAVAFSTITVSPVFVKEAKAAGKVSITTGNYDVPGEGETYDGYYIVGEFNSKNLSTPTPITLDDYKDLAGLKTTDKVAGAINASNQIVLPAATSTAAPAATPIPEYVSFNGVERNKNSDVDAEKYGNKEFEYTSTGKALGAKWYKLNSKSVTTDYATTTTGGSVVTEKVTVPCYKLSSIGSNVKAGAASADIFTAVEAGDVFVSSKNYSTSNVTDTPKTFVPTGVDSAAFDATYKFATGFATASVITDLGVTSLHVDNGEDALHLVAAGEIYDSSKTYYKSATKSNENKVVMPAVTDNTVYEASYKFKATYLATTPIYVKTVGPRYDTVYFKEVNADQLGIYVAIDETSLSPTVKDVLVITEKSDINVAQSQKTVKAMVGKTAILSVDATSSRALTYTWTRNGKELGNAATLTLEKLASSDFGTYTCEVSDGLKSVSVSVNLVETVVSDAKADATTMTTYRKLLDEDGLLQSDAVAIETTIPENSEFVYIWLDGANSVVNNITDATKASFNAQNRSLTFSNKKTQPTDLKVVAVDKAEYNRELKVKLKDVANAAQYEIVTKVEELLQEAKNKLANEKLTALFTENIKLVRDNSKDVSDVIVAKLGDKLTLTAPNVEGVNTKTTYKWNGANVDNLGTTTNKTLSFNTLGIDDFGTYTCEIDLDGDTTTDVYYKANLVYVSDFTASATEVVSAKVGAKDVEFTVNATSSLPITYTWSKYADGGIVNWKETTVTAGKAGTVNKVTIAEAKDTDFATFDTDGIVTANGYQCEVTDGITTKTFVFGLDKVVGFTVDGKTIDSEDNVAAREDSDVTLAPVVKLGESKEVTYSWTKKGSSTVLSTDATYTFKYDGKSTENYVVTITDGVQKIIKGYVVSKFTAVDKTFTKYHATNDESVVYNGKAQTGNVVVKFIDTTTTPDTTFTLVEGKDYTVDYVENINVGIARYTINFIGDFKDVKSADGTKLGGYFYIDRADNEVKLADVTANVGGNVKPVATDLADAPMTIKFYADKELTKEVTEATVKAKAGTYYAQASAIATANYNAAKSNVATITVKALGTPSSLTVTARTSTTMTVKYAKVTGAAGYRIYVKNVKTNYAWKLVKETAALTYKVTGLPAGYNTAVAVRAYDAKKVLAPKYASVTKRTAPGTTSKVTITTGRNSAKLTWNKVTGATHYRVYIKKAGKWTALKTTNKNTFTKTGLKRRTTYTFAVRAYNSTDKLWADKYVAKSAKTK